MRMTTHEVHGYLCNTCGSAKMYQPCTTCDEPEPELRQEVGQLRDLVGAFEEREVELRALVPGELPGMLVPDLKAKLTHLEEAARILRFVAAREFDPSDALRAWLEADKALDEVPTGVNP
jgi:hypothetical protein